MTSRGTAETFASEVGCASAWLQGLAAKSLRKLCPEPGWGYTFTSAVKASCLAPALGEDSGLNSPGLPHARCLIFPRTNRRRDVGFSNGTGSLLGRKQTFCSHASGSPVPKKRRGCKCRGVPLPLAPRCAGLRQNQQSHTAAGL